MYFVFDDAVEDWEGNINQAKLEGLPPQTNPDWWAAKPLTSSLPLLTFVTGHNAPMLDNFFTGTIFDLYSVDLISLIARAGIRFEEFPVLLHDDTTKEVVDKPYKIFHLLEIYPGLDKELSDVNDEKAEINKVVLTRECINANRPLFRLEELSHIVLIHQELKALLDSHNMTGCKYTPIDEYRVGRRHFLAKLQKKGGEI